LVKRFGPGDLTVRLSALESGRDMIDQSVLAPMPVMMSALVSVFVLFFYDATLAWFALGWGLVVMAVSITLAFRVSKAQGEVDRATGDVNGFLFQVLGAMPKLHVAGAEARAFAAWAERFRGAVGQRLTTRSAQQVLIGGVVSTGSTVVLFGAVALTGNIHQVGAFIAFQTTFSLFLGGIAAFTGALASIIQLKPSFERAAELANDTSESGAGRVDPGSLRGDVSLRNVSFRYQSDTPMILNGLDLDIRAGEMVAIVGHSGCGKSTILRMLLGFEQPEQGSVMFDNQDLATLDVGSVRRQLGVVLQDGQLMPGSIFQNLAGSATISESDAWELAEIVALADDIKAMPMKLETMITMNGGAFSGGQRQRLLIARALASRPRILLLDEATSALDNVTQRIVTRNLAEVGMTRIVVAHRLSTIIDADRIVVLDHGAVAEHGTYDQLMAQGGAFHALATRQVV
jgi:ATP-binding cassette subfamily C protein